MFDESAVVVVWSKELAPTVFVHSHPTFRPRMRIPLSHMEDVASLFSKKEEHNKLRQLFQMGMEAVIEDGVKFSPRAFEGNLPRVKGSPFAESEQDIYFKF
ncbi:hypothetical protein K469DRAFT_686358 [Zopfia rhizophila CBS 207.26]|uniref:Uncharacterized protein n=1 Tax=Zopfia rhizophila CBS 207.26 TaxID=1314779 RepID=A0A6A6E9F3_9PEZI|nr:hypothetical protein K469DRAFT_686358 [Zopfia rhizophila CBS 207.26]